jgi:hypothetical protein
LSSSLTDQLKQILDVVGTSLKGVNTSYRKRQKREQEEEQAAKVLAEQTARIEARIREGIWHDPRLDCVAGNGIISELGVGDEWFGAADSYVEPSTNPATTNEKEVDNKVLQRESGDISQAPTEEAQAIDAMPIVILRGFDSKGGGPRREELLNVISQWAAGLAEGQVSLIQILMR